ncbi:MAG: peptidoglycan DD-metalloendopeptidase family protein [Minisyncoccia bacterium]
MKSVFSRVKSYLEQTTSLPFKILGVFFLIGLVIPTRFFLLKQVVVTQGGQNIEPTEQIIGISFDENNQTLIHSAFAISDAIGVDGSPINFTLEDDSLRENMFLVIDKASLMGVNSPYASYLPNIKRHGTITYIVEQGDTVSKIAAKFGVSVNTILWANNLKSISLLKPGQELIILPISGVRHIVKKGDTLLMIAKKYQASVNEIMVFNNLKNESDITEGEELIIPNGQLSNSSSVSLAQLTGLRPMTVDVSSWPTLKNFFSFPVKGGWNTGIWHYFNAVDIVNTCGSPIYAAADGIVNEAKKGWNGGYGNYVKIQHFNGTLTLYAHLGEIYVTEGERVNQNQVIGTMSDTGHATGCHLHFEVRGAQNPFVLKK